MELPQILAAGLNANGEGLLIPVPQDWLSHDRSTELIQSLKTEVNQIRTQVIQQGSTCDLWFSNVCTLNPHPQLDLILQLYDVGCILFGNFVQASGAVFPYYIDLRKIISNPNCFIRFLMPMLRF